MGVATKQRSMKKSSRSSSDAAPGKVFYLYGVSLAGSATGRAVSTEGVDGNSPVEALEVDRFLCWVSSVNRQEYADDLSGNMENLEWLATASVRHQGVVGELSRRLDILPVRFGTVFLNRESLAQHVRERKPVMLETLRRISGSVEWGVKLFREATPSPAMVEASSGRDYLRRKAEMIKPAPAEADPAVLSLMRDLEKLSQDVAPGGKASAGQPGLVWHRSFLVNKTEEEKLTALLRDYSRKLAGRFHIECSGPWPPYSFVDRHGL